MSLQKPINVVNCIPCNFCRSANSWKRFLSRPLVQMMSWKRFLSRLTRVKAMFQANLKTSIEGALVEARLSQCFPPFQGQDHPRFALLVQMKADLAWRTSALPIVNEAAMFFDTDIEFDQDPDLFQLQDCKRNLSEHVQPCPSFGHVPSTEQSVCPRRLVKRPREVGT